MSTAMAAAHRLQPREPAAEFEAREATCSSRVGSRALMFGGFEYRGRKQDIQNGHQGLPRARPAYGRTTLEISRSD